MRPQDFKRWRKSLSLSQKEAAEALGLKRRVVQYYEKGERDGEKVKIPKTVRLACAALAGGLASYQGPPKTAKIAPAGKPEKGKPEAKKETGRQKPAPKAKAKSAAEKKSGEKKAAGRKGSGKKGATAKAAAATPDTGAGSGARTNGKAARPPRRGRKGKAAGKAPPARRAKTAAKISA